MFFFVSPPPPPLLTWRRGRMVSESASWLPDVGSILTALAFFFLSFTEAPATQVHFWTPTLNVFSVAEWLALLRYQWWCLDLVKGSWFKSDPRLNSSRSPAKSRISLESGRMGKHLANDGAAEKTSTGTWPQIWRIARQEVAPEIPHPVRYWKLWRGLTTGTFFFFQVF